jgi:8-oxo-dGTP pyrophosphatase MutT (NUDIX family)
MSAELLFSQLKEKLESTPGRALNLPGLTLRESSVLVPLFIRGGALHALFTKRPMTLRNHAGQISFPGGAREAADPTPLHTALRETHEELGIPPEQVRVLGMLDELPTITQFRIIPFVGVIPGQFAYVPSAAEIEEVIEVPLSSLLDAKFHRTEKRRLMEQEREVHFYDYGAHVIWGATARILKSLLEQIRTLPAFSTLE